MAHVVPKFLDLLVLGSVGGEVGIVMGWLGLKWRAGRIAKKLEELLTLVGAQIIIQAVACITRRSEFLVFVEGSQSNQSCSPRPTFPDLPHPKRVSTNFEPTTCPRKFRLLLGSGGRLNLLRRPPVPLRSCTRNFSGQGARYLES